MQARLRRELRQSHDVGLDQEVVRRATGRPAVRELSEAIRELSLEGQCIGTDLEDQTVDPEAGFLVEPEVFGGRELGEQVQLDVPSAALEVLDGLELRLKARFDGRLYISKSLPYFLELASPDVTKASGLDFLAPRVGFSRARTVAFGDGENDVELLDWAGYAVAVANAHERVLAAADFVCPSVDEEGVAQLIESYLELESQ